MVTLLLPRKCWAEDVRWMVMCEAQETSTVAGKSPTALLLQHRETLIHST